MTLKEKKRMNEIIFCNIFKKFLRMNKNPIKTYDFIVVLADMIGANKTTLNSIITAIFNNDQHYLPTKQEYVYLMRKAEIPVRQIVKKAHISYSTYYSKSTVEMHIEPKFDPIQYAEMMKVLMFFNDTYKDIEGGELYVR